jgi:hypothetical protein
MYGSIFTKNVTILVINYIFFIEILYYLINLYTLEDLK